MHWNDIGDSQGSSVGTFTVGEYMQVADVERLDKFQCLFKLGLGFSRKSHNDIHTDAGMGHHTADVFNPIPIQIRSVSAPHRSQDIVTPGLQWQVEMGLKSS
jgi:hypothetical protein